MKISKATRERAIMILSICACNRVGTIAAEEHTDISQRFSETWRLIDAAWQVAYPAWWKWLGGNRLPTPVYAECEAMLRCGWSPGDK